MRDNSALIRARVSPNGEFYTAYHDIERELKHYSKLLRGKVVYCNCDDPFKSNFFKYFVLNFNALGLKRLITTCYNPFKYQQLSLLSPSDEGHNRPAYKAIVRHVSDSVLSLGKNHFDPDMVFKDPANELSTLRGDGDYASKECIELLDEANVVITNPPFSLFRKYVATLIRHKKGFLIIGNVNAAKAPAILKLIMQGRLCFGQTMPKEFFMPRGEKVDWLRHLTRWFTNLETERTFKEFPLTKRYSPSAYPKLDNYDAINVDNVADIPCDYPGVMAVPITFLDAFNPDRFEILGCTNTPFGPRPEIYPLDGDYYLHEKDGLLWTKLKDSDPYLEVSEPPVGKTYFLANGKLLIKKYDRLFIRNKTLAEKEGD